jgi:hypothetical protein
VSTPALMDLADELGTDAATRFVHVFTDLWPTRSQRIHAAIHARDAPAAMDAVLSLRSAALMAGARSLADQAELIRGTLCRPGAPVWEDAHHLLATMDDLGDRTVQMFSAAIADSPPCG